MARIKYRRDEGGEGEEELEGGEDVFR